MFENLAKADELYRPRCLDTGGVIQYFRKARADFPLLSDVRAILDEAARISTQVAPLIISIDPKGNNLFDQNNAIFSAKKDQLVDEILNLTYR